MKPNWLTINNAATSTEPVEILIQGQIGKNWWDDSGTSEKEFVDALKAIPSDRNIIVGINSEGGSVQDGLGIYNALLRRGDKVSTRIDGYAVSIASVIALAGSRRISPKSSIWMIHEPWMMAQGSAEDMRKAAESLDKHAEVISDIYAQRTGMDSKYAREKMRAETWFKGDEAVEMGFATEATDGAVALNMLPPGQFKNIPQYLLKQSLSAVSPGDQTQMAPGLVPAMPSVEPALNSPSAVVVEGGKTEPESAKPPQKETYMEPNTPAAPITPPANPAPAQDNNNDRIAALELEVRALRAQPVSTPRAVDLGNPGRNAIAAKSEGKARFHFIRDNWRDLLAGGIPLLPQNANTTDSALTTAMLANGLIVVLQNRLAPLSAFTRDFGIDPMKPKAIVQVPIALAGGTAQVNATSFEDTTNFVGNIDNVAITVNRITAGAHLTAAELNSGFRMAQFVEIKAHELADKIQAAINAVILEGTFTITPETSAAAAFGAAELKSLWGKLKKSSIKNIILDGEYYAQFLPDDMESFNPLAGNTYPGWDGFYLNTYWTGATANTVGFACNPQAIAVASGLPLASPNRGMTTNAQVVTLPGLGISVEQQQWYSTSSKTDWANWEIMLGAAAGDSTAGVLVKSA